MKISLVWLIISLVCALPWCLLAQNSPEDYLDAHNAAREKVGVRPLKWDTELELFALKHLIKYIENCEPESSDDPYSSNYARGKGIWKNLSGIQAVEVWVAQKKNYDEQSNACLLADCFSYMQVVTSIATHVGCARVRCNNGSIMISCNYSPPGI